MINRNNMAFCDKCGKEIGKDHKLCQECDKQERELLQQMKKDFKNTNRAGWIGIIGGGFFAGVSFKVLKANGIELGGVLTGLLWFASYWVVRKIVEKVQS